MEPKSLLERVQEVFVVLGARPSNADPKDALMVTAEASERAYTAGVQYLRDEFPNEQIRALGARVWDTIGNQHVRVVYGHNIPVMATGLDKSQTPMLKFVALPINWLEVVATSPFVALGSIVFTGAQAVDMGIDKYDGIRERARAYEAEYLLTLKKHLPEFDPGGYVKRLLLEYPEGLASPSIQPFLYTPSEALTVPVNVYMPPSKMLN